MIDVRELNGGVRLLILRDQDARFCFRPFALDVDEAVQYILDSIILPAETR